MMAVQMGMKRIGNWSLTRGKRKSLTKASLFERAEQVERAMIHELVAVEIPPSQLRPF